MKGLVLRDTGSAAITHNGDHSGRETKRVRSFPFASGKRHSPMETRWLLVILGFVIAFNAPAISAAEDLRDNAKPAFQGAPLVATLPRPVTEILDQSMDLVPATSLIVQPDGTHIRRTPPRPAVRRNFFAGAASMIPPLATY
jgi:hypothetical protein